MTRRKWLTASTIAGIHLSAAWLALSGWLEDPWHSSPTDLRHKRRPDAPVLTVQPDLGFGSGIFFDPHDFGVTRIENAMVAVLEPEAPVPAVGLRIEGEAVHLDWEPPELKRTEMVARNHFGDLSPYAGETEIRLPNGDGWIRPVAQATAYRVGEDSWAGLDEEGRNLRFRAIDPGFRLEEIPAELRSWISSQNGHGPIHRVIFRTAGLARGCCDFAALYDGRTGAEVDNYAKEVGDLEGWLALDFFLGVWHETPVVLRLNLVFSEPVSAILPLSPNSSVVIPNHMRVGYVATVKGKIGRHFTGKWHIENKLRFTSSPDDASILVAMQRFGWESHLAARDPRNKNWRRFRSPFERYLARSWQIRDVVFQQAEVANLSELVVGVIPNQARLWFELEGLGGMPNSTSIDDLFDVRIPWIDFRRLHRSDILGIVGSATEREVSFYDDAHYFDNPPMGNLSAFQQPIENTTPRELLQVWLRDNPDFWAEVSESQDHQIWIREREGFLDRLRNWWATHKPGWIGK